MSVLYINSKVSTEKLLKMAEFVLKNNAFEFNGTVKEQILGAVIGTKCASSYVCVFMSEFETRFIESQQNKPLVWFRCTDNIFFYLDTRGRQIKNIFRTS